MINATQACALADASDNVINKVLEQIGKKIEAAALLGKRELDLESAMNYDKRFEPKEVAFHNPELTPWQRLVAARLKKEGFQVDTQHKTVKIGGGFKSMDEESREESKPFIRVCW